MFWFIHNTVCYSFPIFRAYDIKHKTHVFISLSHLITQTGQNWSVCDICMFFVVVLFLYCTEYRLKKRNFVIVAWENLSKKPSDTKPLSYVFYIGWVTDTSVSVAALCNYFVQPNKVLEVSTILSGLTDTLNTGRRPLSSLL